jgi:hypothetical protein
MMLSQSSEERIEKCESEKALGAKSEYVKPVLSKQQNLIDITNDPDDPTVYPGSYYGSEKLNG